MVSLEAVWGLVIVVLALLSICLTGLICRFFFNFICKVVFRARYQEWSNTRKFGLCFLYVVLLLGLTLFATFPSYIRNYGHLCKLLHLQGDKAFSTDLHRDFPDITIVTFSSDGYSDPLENMIGSLHVWAKGVPIVVYDLGISRKHLSNLKALDNVRIIPFNFSNYPNHVQYMSTYAFKPLLILDAVNRFGSVLCLDAGIEVRGTLRPVFESIRTSGYFFVEATKVDPLTRVHPTTISHLNVSELRPNEVQCYAGMHGYLAGSKAVRNVLLPTAMCALNPNCIDPPGSGHENHRYEQAVFSMYIRENNMHCHTGNRFSEHLPTTLNPDVLAINQPQLFFFRRWRYPKPYAVFASRTKKVELVVPQGVSEESAEVSSAIFENGATDRKNSDNVLMNCLRENNYDMDKCEQYAKDWQAKAGKKKLLGTAQHKRDEEIRGWFLGWAAAVFWYWPLTLHDVIAMCVIGLIFIVMDYYRLLWQYVYFALAVCFFAFLLFRGLSVAQTCMPKRFVEFELMYSDSDAFFELYYGKVSCQGPSNKLTFKSQPFFFKRGIYRYAFFESSAYGYGVISYAVGSSESKSWTYMGVALIEQFTIHRPCVFSFEKRVYMLPHTPDSNRVILYTTKQFPKGWHVLRDLATFERPVSAMLHYVNDEWYLSAHSGDDKYLLRAASLEDEFVPVIFSQALEQKTAVCRPTY